MIIKFKYFLQFIIILILFLIFKVLRLKLSSSFGGKIFQVIGPYFRSEKIINQNLANVFPDLDDENKSKIIKNMWNNYGRVLAEYMFFNIFRQDKGKIISIEGKEILKQINDGQSKAIFVSGHFANFELMAMEIEKAGINLATIYRPLNNIFLNKIMEFIRKKYICKNQIKKGIGGLKLLIKLTKKNYSSALMIDQRVSEGIKAKFFNKDAYTTTIPAQLIKRYEMPIIPVSIKRINKINFKIFIHQPIKFNKNESVEMITNKLNKIIEDLVLRNPHQWIWTHNRWK